MNTHKYGTIMHISYIISIYIQYTHITRVLNLYSTPIEYHYFWAPEGKDLCLQKWSTPSTSTSLEICQKYRVGLIISSCTSAELGDEFQLSWKDIFRKFEAFPHVGVKHKTPGLKAPPQQTLVFVHDFDWNINIYIIIQYIQKNW